MNIFIKIVLAILSVSYLSNFANAESQLGTVSVNMGSSVASRSVSTALGTFTQGSVVSWSLLKNYYGNNIDISAGGNLLLTDSDNFKVVILDQSDVERPNGVYGLTNLASTGSNMIIFLNTNVSNASNFGNYNTGPGWSRFSTDLSGHMIIVGAGASPLTTPNILTQVNNEGVNSRLSKMTIFDNLKTKSIFENTQNFRPGVDSRNSGSQTLYLNGFYTLSSNGMNADIMMFNQQVLVYKSYLNSDVIRHFANISQFYAKNSIIDGKSIVGGAPIMKSLNSILIGNRVQSLSYSTVDYSYITNFEGAWESGANGYMRNSLIFNNNGITLNGGQTYQNNFFYNNGGIFRLNNFQQVSIPKLLLNNVFAQNVITDSNNLVLNPTIQANGKISAWNDSSGFLSPHNNMNFKFSNIAAVPGLSNIPYCTSSIIIGGTSGGCDYNVLFRKFTSSTIN